MVMVINCTHAHHSINSAQDCADNMADSIQDASNPIVQLGGRLDNLLYRYVATVKITKEV